MTAHRVLLLGLGQIGMGYDIHLPSETVVLSHSRAFHLNPDFCLSGAVDKDPAKREAFTQLYSAPAFSNIDEALQSLSPQVVVIATPTAQHEEATRTILLATQPAIILCEKPLANNLIEAQKIVEACRESGTQLYVNYIRRADSAVLTIKRMLETREIRGPFTGAATYGKDIVHNGTHMLDLLAFWFGFPTPDSTKIGAESLDGRLDVTVQFECGEVMFKEPGLESDDFAIKLNFTNGVLDYTASGSSVIWTAEGKRRKIMDSMDFYQLRVSEEISSAIKGVKPNLCSGEEAIKSLELARKIIEKVGKE